MEKTDKLVETLKKHLSSYPFEDILAAYLLDDNGHYIVAVEFFPPDDSAISLMEREWVINSYAAKASKDEITVKSLNNAPFAFRAKTLCNGRRLFYADKAQCEQFEKDIKEKSLNYMSILPELKECIVSWMPE